MAGIIVELSRWKGFLVTVGLKGFVGEVKDREELVVECWLDTDS